MVDEYDDPKVTISLLGELVHMGFSEGEFKRIHHFGERATIQGHLKYCETVKRFRRGGKNCGVQRQLREALANRKKN